MLGFDSSFTVYLNNKTHCLAGIVGATILDHAPIDEIYACEIFKRVAIT